MHDVGFGLLFILVCALVLPLIATNWWSFLIGAHALAALKILFSALRERKGEGKERR